METHPPTNPQPKPQGMFAKTIASVISQTMKSEAESSRKSLPGAERNRPEKIDWVNRRLGWRSYHHKHELAAIQIHDFLMDWVSNQKKMRVITLTGDTGVGKTFIARKMYRWALKAGCWGYQNEFWKHDIPGAWMVYWPDVMAKRSDGAAWDDLLTDLTEHSLLILDDVGRESDRYKSGENIQAFLSILSARINRWTVITTNKRPERFASDWDPAVEDRLYRYGGQVADLFGVDSFNLQEVK